MGAHVQKIFFKKIPEMFSYMNFLMFSFTGKRKEKFQAMVFFILNVL